MMSHPFVRRQGTAFALLMILFLWLGTAPTALAQSTLSINPTSGPSGTVVNLSVSNVNFIYECSANGGVFVSNQPGNTASYTVNQLSGSITFECVVQPNGGDTAAVTNSVTFTVTAPQIQVPQPGPGQISPPQIDPNIQPIPPQPQPDDAQPPPPPQDDGPGPVFADADGDGVEDSADRCPFVSGRGDQYGGVSGADGCPVDSDADGVNDGVDPCPFAAGPPSNSGCPVDDGAPAPVEPTTAPQDDPPPLTLPALPQDGQCYVGSPGGNVNVRADATTNSNIVGVVDAFSIILVDAVVENDIGERWYGITLLNGTSGFVRSDVVRTTAACDSLMPGDGFETRTQALSGDSPLCFLESVRPTIPVYYFNVIRDERMIISRQNLDFSRYITFGSSLSIDGPYPAIGQNTFREIDRNSRTTEEGTAYYVELFSADTGLITGWLAEADVNVLTSQACANLPIREDVERTREAGPIDPPEVGNFPEPPDLSECPEVEDSLGNIPLTVLAGIDSDDPCAAVQAALEGLLFEDLPTPVNLNWLDDASTCPVAFLSLTGYVERLSLTVQERATLDGVSDVLNNTPDLCGIAEQLAANTFPAEFSGVDNVPFAAATVCLPGDSGAVAGARISQYPAASGLNPAQLLASGQPGADLCNQVQLVNRVGELNNYVQTAYTELTQICTGYTVVMESPNDNLSALKVVYALSRQNVNLDAWATALSCNAPLDNLDDFTPDESVAIIDADIPPALEDCRAVARELAAQNEQLDVGQLYTILQNADPCAAARHFIDTGIPPARPWPIEDLTLECAGLSRGQGYYITRPNGSRVYADTAWAVKVAVASQSLDQMCNDIPIVDSYNLPVPSAAADPSGSVDEVCWAVMAPLANTGDAQTTVLFSLATRVSEGGGVAFVPETHPQKFDVGPGEVTYANFTAYVPEPDIDAGRQIVLLSNRVPGVSYDTEFFDQVPDEACQSGEFPVTFVNEQSEGQDYQVDDLGRLVPAGQDSTQQADIGAIADAMRGDMQDFVLPDALPIIDTPVIDIAGADFVNRPSTPIGFEGGFYADSDGDGFPNGVDVCPQTPGDVTASDINRLGCPEDSNIVPADVDGDGLRDVGDEDGDGVINVEDECPYVAGQASPQNPILNGCLQSFPEDGDRDNDGINVTEDVCYDQPGPRNTNRPEINGCPPDGDRDGDGIVNSVDECPLTVGIASDNPLLNGCPDTTAPPVDSDGDRINDVEDVCPNVYGEAGTNLDRPGCPGGIGDPDGDGLRDNRDIDQDGVINSEDRCPFVPGEASPQNPILNGCVQSFPEDGDRDNDGVRVDEDVCYDQAGVRSANPLINGCPPDGDYDGDGVINSEDQCPTLLGSPANVPFLNGCPFSPGGQLEEPTGNNNPAQPGGSSAGGGSAGGGIVAGGGAALPLNPVGPNAAPQPSFGGFTPTSNTGGGSPSAPVYVQPASNVVRPNVPPALLDENQRDVDVIELVDELPTSVTDTYAALGIFDGEQGDIFQLVDGQLTPLLEQSPDTIEAFPVISPDGQFIAFLRSDGEGNVDVLLYSTEREIAVPFFRTTDELTPAPYEPAWTPDGGALMVTMETTDGGVNIYRLDAQSLSGEPELFIENAASPVVSPNGRMVAFVRPQADTPAQVDVILRSLSREQDITLAEAQEGQVCYAPRFAQDSITVFFLCDSAAERATGLFKYSLDGIEQITLDIPITSQIFPGPVNGLLSFADGSTVYLSGDNGETVTPLFELGEGVSVDSIAWRSSTTALPSIANTE